MEPSSPQVPAPAPAQPQQQAAASNPGQGLGIASLIVSIVGFGWLSLVSLILGIIGMSQSKKAGQSNGMALAGVIISAIGMIGGVLWFVLVVLLSVAESASTTY